MTKTTAYANVNTALRKTKKTFKKAKSAGQRSGQFKKKPQGMYSYLNNSNFGTDPIFDGKVGSKSLKIYYLFSGTHFRRTIYSPTQIFIKASANAPPKAFVYVLSISTGLRQENPCFYKTKRIKAAKTLGVTSWNICKHRL